jgi:spore germination protein KC
MELESYGKSTVISALSSQKTEEKTTTTIKSMQMDHAGIFKEGRLVGYIDSTQVQSYLLITNPNLRETLFTIKHPKSPETYISLEIMRGEAKREIKLEGNRLKGTITVSLLARIADVHESRFPLDPDTFDEIENALSVYIKNNLTNLIDDLQNRFGTDAIGFGQIVYKKEHNFWKNLEDDWDAYFIQMPIYVNVNVHIKRTGFITKPSEAR